MLKKIGWFGSITGLIGSFLLALNNTYSGCGFAVFLISNAAWIIYGIQSRTPSMVVMQIGFTLTSILGIYRWNF